MMMGPAAIWLTGLSGAGKSTLAGLTREALMARGQGAIILDGDLVRSGLNADLGFSAQDREENIRRVAWLAAYLLDAGVIPVVALISPFAAAREGARAVIGAERFFEVHVHAPLEVCEGRDPKGLYRRARSGEIPEFTGIDSPYEPPSSPALVLHTAHETPLEATDRLVETYVKRFVRD